MYAVWCCTIADMSNSGSKFFFGAKWLSLGTGRTAETTSEIINLNSMCLLLTELGERQWKVKAVCVCAAVCMWILHSKSLSLRSCVDLHNFHVHFAQRKVSTEANSEIYNDCIWKSPLLCKRVTVSQRAYVLFWIEVSTCMAKRNG